jgi:hypothetical protein
LRSERANAELGSGFQVQVVAPLGRAEGLIFNIDGLSAVSAVMNYAPRPEQLATRDAAARHRCG